MIALNETNEYAAEIPFFLPLASNPIEGKTGHTFVLGEAQILLPGGTWTDVALAKIVELDYGWYVIRLTAVQCTTEGVVKYRVVDSAITPTFQPARGSETIGLLGGDITVGGTGYLMFYLPDENDPIYADPIEGAFPAGDVFIRLPDGVFGAGDPDLVVDFGEGLYGYPLDADDTVKAGKAFVFASAAGAQSSSTYSTILGVGTSSTVSEETPTTSTVTLPSTVLISTEDHVTAAVNRLCEFAKRKAA